jgi:hypothetical protein
VILALVLFGLLVYFAGWFSHDKGWVPRPGVGPAWHEPPAAVRRILRRGIGPILPFSVMVESIGVFYVLRGLAALDGPSNNIADSIASAGITASILLTGVVGIVLALVYRSR